MGLRFIGDFATSPTRTELEGTREGKEPSFILRHYFGDRLRAAVLVNRTDEEEPRRSSASSAPRTPRGRRDR